MQLGIEPAVLSAGGVDIEQHADSTACEMNRWPAQKATGMTSALMVACHLLVDVIVPIAALQLYHKTADNDADGDNNHQCSQLDFDESTLSRTRHLALPLLKHSGRCQTTTLPADRGRRKEKRRGVWAAMKLML